MFMPQAANSVCGMEMIMEEKDTELRDEGLRGNEKIEEAIAGLQKEPTQEMLAHALTVVLFVTALQADGVEGIILNPWNRTLMLEKELIRIILGQQG